VEESDCTDRTPDMLSVGVMKMFDYYESIVVVYYKSKARAKESI
jgi:hypothetical protein